ncbi:MAG: adenylate/guanylate cyclase domain-containing response regulator [Candidatus Rokuibacteriota bacterium]|nr:MAG: adenylate/guanylate cyclase domain-containing response regulator [Candidatus Rokubacteria bacterium]
MPREGRPVASAFCWREYTPTVVRTPARILVADDTPANVRMLEKRLQHNGYDVVVARDGEEALAVAHATHPDLILLDIMMPKVDGIAVCRRLKGDPAFPFTPIIMVTAMADSKDVVAGLEAGGDDYLTKPVDQQALVARVRSMLRIKALHDTVQAQTAELARWNATLEERVARQLAELERVGRLKRFFSPQLAELIVRGGADDPLVSHRREVTVVFIDLRGFTAFAERAEPEEVMGVLREYHARMGALVLASEGTLERFTGDGMMIFFNDPVIVPDAVERAVRMTVAMRDGVDELAARWRKRGHELHAGLGIAQGYATIGAIGFEGRLDYGAIGTVTNLAFRLCAEAATGQILISQSVYAAAGDLIDAESIGELTLKGFQRPVAAYNVRALKG